MINKKNIEIPKIEIEAINKVKDYKRIAESNIVSILWKQPELFNTYDSLTIDNFLHNEWKVYFQIGYDIILKEGKEVLDEITVGLYLEKHLKLKEKYETYGGYETIINAGEYIQIENIDGYVKDLNKWNTVIKLAKFKFPIAERLSDYVDMSAENIYDEYEAILNHIFVDVDGDDETLKMSDGIYELIDELDEGLAIGLPYYNSDLLTEETGGSLIGNITLVGGLSGSGKSTFIRNTVIPEIIDKKEKIVIIVNEESLKKWQRELIVYACNNVFQTDVQKYKLRNGRYTHEFKSFLKDKVAKWIKDNDDGIIFKPLKKFNTNKAIKIIKKYSHMGVKYYVLDTYKADADIENEAVWLNMQQNMVKIYDTVKPACKNVHIWCTFQLKKSSAKQRCYTQENIGMATNIIDVASTCIMIRNIFEDEMLGGKHELKVFKLAGKNKKSKIPVPLEKDKHYQIIFVIKNREGSSNEYQIVVEHDLSRNVYKEIGITVIPCDF